MRTQIINGVEYVYEDYPYWDSDKQRGSHKRVYIGKNVNGIFIPNKRYKLQLELEAAKADIKPGPAPVTDCQRNFFGATYLLDQIGHMTGVTEDLKSCFPEDYEEILSLAYFLILEGDSALYRFHRWAYSHEHPYGHDIPSQRSSELFGRIHEEGKMSFFKKQAKRRLEKEYLAYDTTSISSHSQSLKQVKYGKNKEHDPLPQINLALLYGETSRLPVYYRKLPGNIVDVKTIGNLLKDIDFLEIKKVNLVMDRGFYSEKNINELYRLHHKFLLGAKVSLSFVQKKLDEIRDIFVSRKNFYSEFKLYVQSFMMDWDYTELKPRNNEIIKEKRRIYVHYYFDPQHRADDDVRFNAMLDMLEEELVNGHYNQEHQRQYEKYFEQHKTPVRGLKITPKQEAIDKALKNSGYFVLLSNEIKDPIDALRTYRSRDVIEKAFGNLKERLNMRRESVASEENLEGKLFIQFVALIYLSYIKKAMDENNLFKNYTMQELLDNLDIIEKYQQPGRESYISEVTEKQKSLYKAMGVTPPA